MQQSLFQEFQQPSDSSVVQMDPGFIDRDYQAEAISGTLKAFDEGNPGALVRGFTGSGKTYMGARVAMEWLNMAEDHRVFVCAHERQLVTQFRDELGEFLGVPIGLEMSTDGAVNFSESSPRVIVSCRATLGEDKTGASRLYKFNNREFKWLLIIDEAHRWAFSLPSCCHVLEWFEKNGGKRMALTATPERSDGVSLERIAPAVALDFPMFSSSGRSAIEAGWSVPFDQKFIHIEGVDFQNLREVSGDFDTAELDQILQEKEQLDAMIKPMLDLVGDRRTLIFNAGVNLTKAVSRALNAEIDINGGTHGRAEWLDGSVQDDVRRRTFEKHQRGEFQFLSVCGLCREGYNDPGIQAIAIFRPTKQASLAEQMLGRGSRPLRGLLNGIESPAERREAIAASDKPDCMIIDLVGASGLGKCATTAHLYAVGQDDIPVDILSLRANEILMEEDEEISDPGEAVKKAAAEISEERETARQERERQEQIELERKRKEARIQSEVNYQVSDHAGSLSGKATGSEPSTARQVGKLRWLGLNEAEARKMSKRQASVVIGKLLTKKYGQQKPQQYNSNTQATEQQLRVLVRHQVPAAAGISYEQAASAIQEINTRLKAGGVR